MTLERTGTGTGRYVAPKAGSGIDPYTLANPTLPESQQEPLPAPIFETFRVGTRDSIIGFRAVIHDLRGGLNALRGPFELLHTKTKASTLDDRTARQLILPQKTTTQATPDPTSAPAGIIYSANVSSRLVIATTGFNVGNKVLLKETSATDPTIIDTQYDPGLAGGDAIRGIWPIVIGSASSSPRLAIGRAFSVAQVVTNLGNTPPTTSNMNALTVDCNGMIQTALPDAPILMHISGSMYSLPSSSAIGAAPTLTMTGLAGGGYPLGLLGLNGSGLTTWWVLPKGAFSSDVGVYKINQEGTDRNELTFPLARTLAAGIIRDGIWGSDGQRIVFNNGRTKKDLKLLEARVNNSDYVTIPWSACSIHNQELYVELRKYDPAGVLATQRWLEHYNWDLDAWQPVSAVETLTTSLGAQTDFLGYAGLPYSKQTQMIHNYADGSWRRIYAPSPLVDPFTLRNTGSSSSGGVEYEATGTWSGAQMIAPGQYAYCPMKVRRIGFAGDVDSGGTDATVDVTMYGPGSSIHATARFGAGYPGEVQWVDCPDGGYTYFIEPEITITQGSGSTRKTPQALPIIIEGYIFLDGVPDVDFIESET